MAILTAKPSIVGPGRFASARNFGSVLRVRRTAAAISGSFIARTTSSSRSAFRTSAQAERRGVSPAARAAPRISAKPLAVRPCGCSDDMGCRLSGTGARIGAPVYPDESHETAERFKARGLAAGKYHAPEYLRRHDQRQQAAA